MDKPIAVLELTTTAIKFVVGYELDGEPVVLYTLTKPIDHYIESGTILNPRALIEEIQKSAKIEDAQAKLRITISEVILVLPPLGLDIYHGDRTTYVVSNVGTISKLDISNVISLVKKETIPHDNGIVDIIPDVFILDQGRTYIEPPLGLNSNSLSVHAKVYTLPSSLIQSYRTVVETSGIRIKRVVVAPYAISRLLLKEELPTGYLYVDYGANITTVSLLSKGSVFASSHFLTAGNRLTEMIANKFNIDFKEAEKIKRRYGYDTRSIGFDPKVAKGVLPDGKEVTYTVKDLNDVIKEYLDNFVYSLQNCIEKLLTGYKEEYLNLPLIFGGGASRLGGFLEFMKEQYPNRDIRKVPLNVIGARHESYLNAVGAILTASKYMGTLEDNRGRVTSISRENAIPEENKRRGKNPADEAADEL